MDGERGRRIGSDKPELSVAIMGGGDAPAKTDGNVRSYLLDELGDPDAPAGSRSWCLYTANEIRKMLYDKQQLGARLHDYVSAFQERQGWQELGFLTWEDFCVKRLQVRADEVEAEARARIAAMAENAKPLMTFEENGRINGRGKQIEDYNYNSLCRRPPGVVNSIAAPR